MRTTFQFNSGWRFHRGDLEKTNNQAIHANRFDRAEWLKSGNHGIARAGYPDTDWKDVDLPHDFVVESAFKESANAVHGSLPTNVGWYRKNFKLPDELIDQRVHLEFDGVYRDTTVWVNGHLAGRHLSGYTSFSLDITELCLQNTTNVVALRCDAREFELWSYEGGGIYRDVRLVATDSIHIPYCGTCVRSDFPNPSDLSVAMVEMLIDVSNLSDCATEATARFTIFKGEEKNPIYEGLENIKINAGSRCDITHHWKAKNSELWSPQRPILYRLETSIIVSEEIRDLHTTHFGIRSILFHPERGTILNGAPIKLKGVCNHQDHAGVGVAVCPTIDEWRLSRLKAMGCNAIRTAHNPPAPHLLDLCDRMGFLVMDEARLPGTAPELLEQLSSLIIRDRNHPCVCLWSLGNEEMLIQENASGPKILKRMQDLAHRLDPTRPCIYSANCDFNEIAENFKAHGFLIDVFGANYTMRDDTDGKLTAEAERYDEFRKRFPEWPIIASESGGSASTRGLYAQEYYEGKALYPHPEAIGADAPVYLNPKRTKQVTAYAETLTPWGRSIEQTWEDCASRNFLGGTFLWTGFDYRGETYPFSWPAVITRYGLMDLCGFPKDSYFYYQAEWTEKAILHLFPHWNLDLEQGEYIDLWAYSNCSEVEVWLNGSSLGRKRRPSYGKLKWEVPYSPGILEGAGYDSNGKEIVRSVLETSESAFSLHLDLMHQGINPDGSTVAILSVCAVDEKGRKIDNAENLITFITEPNLQILGVGNGNPTSHESEKAARRKLFNGYAQLLVRSYERSGKMTICAQSEGLQSATCVLEVESSPEGKHQINGCIEDGHHAEKINPIDGSL
jgi:beta-galactosidase